MSTPHLVAAIKELLRDIGRFAEHGSGLKLRAYQMPVAQAIVESVLHKRGDTFVVMFPRQSGKNELEAQIEAYLLTLFGTLNGEIVKASPTWRPQSINAMRRLERVLTKNLLTRGRWKTESGYAFRLDTARAYFMSAAPEANSVGHTASVLLECDEAQDVQPAKWDKDFAPMGASTNATTVFWGTAWTAKTLLARERKAAEALQRQDGRRRVFHVTADQVSAEVPAYAAFVAKQIAKLGRNHPLVKTQLFSEEIDAEGGLFTPARRALLQGQHAPQAAPLPGHAYAILIDVAGADETQTADPAADSDKRDATALTVVELDMRTVGDPLIAAPTYRIVARHGWQNVKHASLYGQLRGLIDHWQAQWIVVDATGIGAGLASFLGNAYGARVTPFVFSVKTKAEAGFGILACVETGRLKDHVVDGSPEQAAFWQQLEWIEYEAQPNQGLKWGSPEGKRDPLTGDMMHDDWVLSLALVHVLDALPWGIGASEVIQAPDPLAAMERNF
jgi:hypothetical protein